jgi:hypothetical protein
MLTESFLNYNDLLKQIRLEKAGQFAVFEDDRDGVLYYVYSRPVRYVKEVKQITK